jgi:hypothetical protein
MSEKYGNTPRKIQECKNGFEREWSRYFWNEVIQVAFVCSQAH